LAKSIDATFPNKLIGRAHSSRNVIGKKVRCISKVK
jgi:hypothetical protein